LAGDELTRFAGEHPDRVVKLVYLDAAYERVRVRGNSAKFHPTYRTHHGTFELSESSGKARGFPR
jgi:hypothetical protein